MKNSFVERTKRLNDALDELDCDGLDLEEGARVVENVRDAFAEGSPERVHLNAVLNILDDLIAGMYGRV